MNIIMRISVNTCVYENPTFFFSLFTFRNLLNKFNHLSKTSSKHHLNIIRTLPTHHRNIIQHYLKTTQTSSKHHLNIIQTLPTTSRHQPNMTNVNIKNKMHATNKNTYTYIDIYIYIYL